MKVSFSSRAALCALVAVAACKQPDKPQPPVSPPNITSFTVSKARIARGETVSFAFATERATSVQLLDQTGVELSTTFDAAAGTGTASATPTASSFYVLRATGEGGRDSAFLQVAVDEGLKSVFLVAVPAEVKPGQAVTVLWAAPGAKNLSIRAGTRDLVATPPESGSADDTPALSTTYTLSADKLDGTTLTATAQVKVNPVILEFAAAPPVARPGETITLSWRTAGAERAVVSESTFGQLVDTTTDVATGSFAFVVPGATPDGGVTDGGTSDGGTGLAVRDGFPLHFQLVASTATPAQTVTRAIDGRVGAGPVIDLFDAPATATSGRPLPLSWQTTNAFRVELQANGVTLFAPLAGAALSSSFTVPGLTADTTFTLIAYDYTGLSVRKSVRTTVAPAPHIGTFTMPATVASASTAATATWTTTNASTVLLRVKRGPAVFFETAAARVASGSTSVTVMSRTTFVLEAYNSAGDLDSAERTVDVTTPSGLSITPNPAPAGTPITAAWDVTALSPTDLPGLPGDATSTSSATTFNDLETAPDAQTLVFADRDDSVARIHPPEGFTFPFITTAVSSFTVSTNGFVAITPSTARPDNLDLAGAYTGPAMLAPFWDDLDLGATGTVKWLVDGAAFPRRLTIQWSNVAIVGQAGTVLTFQVQLYESGKFRFVYKTLTGTDADGTGATVGAVLPGVFSSTVSYNTNSPGVAADEELLWFSNNVAKVTGNQTLTFTATTRTGFFAETATGFVPVFATARIMDANTILVSEAMPLPAATLTSGQWIELFNPGSEPVELSSLSLVSTSGPAAPYLIPQGTTVPAAGYLLLGQSTDVALNGNAPVTQAWGASELPMTDTDAVELQLPGLPDGGVFTISRLAWTAVASDGGVGVVAGTSAQAPERAINASLAPLTCTRTKTFGTTVTQIGTPGTANETCFDYALDPIPVAWEDISGFGTPVVTGTLVDDVYFQVALPAPFTYFAQPQTQVTISSNGWLGFGTFTSSYASNKTTPSLTSTPVGVIAPFWDDLKLNGAPGSQIYLARAGDHTIVQWQELTYWTGTPMDELNFEVKLFDSGVIEFHYSTMTSGNSSNHANGNTATVWIERPSTATVAAALPVGRNQPVISPNTAWRFTPAN